MSKTRFLLIVGLMLVATPAAQAQIGSGWTRKTYTKKIHLDNESGLQIAQGGAVERRVGHALDHERRLAPARAGEGAEKLDPRTAVAVGTRGRQPRGLGSQRADQEEPQPRRVLQERLAGVDGRGQPAHTLVDADGIERG